MHLLKTFCILVIFSMATLIIFAQDTTPPSPSPAVWQLPPTAAGGTAIRMVAQTATDPSGVEYYFECLSGSCNSSGWQSSPIYEDTGLTEGNSYTYRVKARDLSTNQNSTLYSTSESASPISTQAGGFTYGWANYDNSDGSGLGSQTVFHNFTGARDISHAPAPGVHPRIFFNPEDIPDIQNRLTNTSSGQSIAALIHAHTTLLHLGYGSNGTYNHWASYGNDADGNKYIDNGGYWDRSPYYTKLVNEDPTVWNGVTEKIQMETATIMAFEAFECLMNQGGYDSDTGMNYDDRAQDLATAMAFWASLIVGDASVNSSSFRLFGGPSMALCYDLNYNVMTTAQRDAVRAGLAQVTPSDATQLYGAETQAYATTSNWATLNSFEIMTNLAIEGETGYQAGLTDTWMRALHNFITYGWHESGSGYEGLGKNYQYVTTLIACAKRGYSLLGHPNVKAYGEQFLPAIMQPYGHAFNSYDVWGGSGYDAETGGYKFNSLDAAGLKWVFPNNNAIDFVWRNFIEQAYNLNGSGYLYQQVRPDNSYYNFLIPLAVFASDYNGGNWETENEATFNGNPDYLAPVRGLAVMRSGFTQDALSTQFHCRQNMGGHTHGDRNDFTLSGLNRMWVRKTYGGSQFQPTYYHSCILVNDMGVPITDLEGDKARQPGTILDWQPSSNFAQVAGDATHAYSWEWHWQKKTAANDHSWLGTNNWEEVTETWNDFLYQPGAEPHYNIPFYDYAHWTDGDKYERIIKRPYNMMERVYRNVSMFKGTNPFILVVDDVQKDNNVQNYKWVAQIANDLTIASTDVNLVDSDYRCDIILEEPSSTGNRRLLVRVLNNEGYTGSTPPGYTELLQYVDIFNGNTYSPNPNFDRYRLVVESNSVAPDFKVMMYPYEDGSPLPITTWNSTHDTLTVDIDGEISNFAFEPNGNGRTLVHLIDNSPYHTLNLTAFLEGAYDGSGSMHQDLYDQNLLPLAQPYNTAPWNYAGSEAVSNTAAFPTTVVDWVLVEARDGTDPDLVIERKAALLLADGSIVNPSDFSAGVRFYDLTDGAPYRFVIRHRNHLDLMSSSNTGATVNMTYEFSQVANVQGGSTQLISMGDGNYAMIAGDFNGEGIMSVNDFNHYLSLTSTIIQYVDTDVNMDGYTTVADYNRYRANLSAIGIDEIRY